MVGGRRGRSSGKLPPPPYLQPASPPSETNTPHHSPPPGHGNAPYAGVAVDDFEHEPPRHRIVDADSPDEDEDSVVRDRRAWASIRHVGGSSAGAMDDSLLGDGEMENPWLHNRSGIEFGALAGIGITFSEEGFFNPTGTGTAATVFLIVNAALGAGLLNFPQSFDLAGGIATAVSVQAVLVVFVVTALWILAFSADWNQKASIITAIYPIPASPRASTMQEAMEGACGEWGRRLTSMAIVLYTFGTCITFIIIIGDQFDRTLASLYGHDFCHYWYMDRTFTMSMCSMLLILPLCFPRKIDFLRVPSTVGVLAIFYVIGLVAYKYFSGEYTPGPIKTRPDHWSDVFLVVPTICFGYQCHVSAVPIYSCMKRRNVWQFGIVSTVAILICVFCYTSTAIFGYLTFGAHVSGDILMSYSAKQPEVLVAVVAMALKTITTYPILLFCGREAIKSLITECSSCQLHLPRAELTSRIVIAGVWFFLTLLLAVFIPDIGEVIKMLGSLAAVFIFILPGLSLFQYAERSDPSFRRKKTVFWMLTAFVFMALGSFIFGVVFTQTIQYNLIDHPSEVPICY